MQNTYLGQTAGGIVKTAKIVQMRAGNWEAVVRTKNGAEHVAIAGGNVLTLTQAHGVVVQLCMSNRSAEKMRALAAEIEARCAAEA